MDGFKKWFLESYGSNGGLEPPKQDPGGLSPADIRKGRGSALNISRHPELDKEPPISGNSPTNRSSRYVRNRMDDLLKMQKKK